MTLVLSALLLLTTISGCENFYSSSNDPAYRAITAAGLPDNGILIAGYPLENQSIYPDDTLYYTFKEAVTDNSVNTNSIQIINTDTSTAITGLIISSSNAQTFEISARALTTNRRYKIVFHSSIKLSSSLFAPTGETFEINFKTYSKPRA